MKGSKREWVLGLVTVGVALYAIGGALLYRYINGVAYQEQQMSREALLLQLEQNRRLVDERERWESRMAEMQDLMPVFAADRQMDVHWLSLIEGVAAKHGLNILRHEPGQEAQEGPIYELPIFCRQWEGSLDSLVRFLFDLENEGAMVDVRYLFVKPKDRNIRTGRFDIYCAYRREER